MDEPFNVTMIVLCWRTEERKDEHKVLEFRRGVNSFILARLLYAIVDKGGSKSIHIISDSPTQKQLF
jgi:hypothetical protein